MRALFYILLMCMLAAGLLLAGGRLALRQADWLSITSTVPGQVVQLQRTPHRVTGETIHITYEYTVAGQTHTGRHVTPLPRSFSQARADELARQFAPEQAIRVFCDRADPQRAFLVAEPAFYPYIMILLAGVALGLILPPIRHSGLLSQPPCPVKLTDLGWYRLRQSMDMVQIGQLYLLVALVWYVLGLGAAAHIFLTLGRPDGMMTAYLIVYLLGGAVPLRAAIIPLRTASLVRALHVSMTLPAIELDHPIIVRVELQSAQRLVAGEVRVMLECVERNHFTNSVLYQSSHIIARQATLTPQQPVFEECRFEVPRPKQRPSSPFTRLHLPRCDWQITIQAGLNQRPYRASFPFQARQPSHTTTEKM